MIRDTADIAIVGAGIAGLTTALSLAWKDRPCVIYEKARIPSEAGAGIQLSPNATRILIGLGLEHALERRVVAPQAVVLYRGRSARELARVPLAEAAEARHGAPYWAVHRADLQDVLLKAVMAEPTAIIRRGLTVTRLDQDPATDRVTATLESATGIETRNHDALIAADGLWSTTRSFIIDNTRPRFSGFRAFRAVIPLNLLPEEMRQPVVGAWLGGNGHIVHYPVIGGYAVNLVAITRDNDPTAGWGEPAKAEAIAAIFRGWASPLRKALEIPGDTWRTWAIFDRPPARGWSKGVAIAIGDAAHPMLPFLAQGGAMAIEDAKALAEELVIHAGQPEKAFAAFEKARMRRVRSVMRASRKNGRIFHMTGLRALVRDLSIGLTPRPMLMRHLDWLYGHVTD